MKKLLALLLLFGIVGCQPMYYGWDDYVDPQLPLKRQQEQERKQKQLVAFVEGKKSICKAYGFSEENAIATCVQTEINNEINRLQAQQVYANAQARANATQRNNALSNMGRCLSAEPNFAACSNAWGGYTPKKIYKCDYDVFANQISSTCREQ